MDPERTENTTPVTSATSQPKKIKRRKKTVSDIEQQIKELQQKKLELIGKAKVEIGDFVISTLEDQGISFEDVEENKDLVFNYLEKNLREHANDLKDEIKD